MVETLLRLFWNILQDKRKHEPALKDKDMLVGLETGTECLPLWLCFDSPADECCDDDTPGSAAAVCAGLTLVFFPPAAQTNGIDEQEHEVQGQTGERHSSQ